MTQKNKLSARALEKYVEEHGDAFLKMPNVTSVGVGYAEDRHGVVSDELSIQVTVEEKFTIEALGDRDEEPLPETVTIQGVEVQVDVIEGTYALSYAGVGSIEERMRKAFINPIRPGVSVGHSSVTAGTVGALVFDAADSTPYLLSNWHVLHGKVGQIGDPIVQPGPEDSPFAEQNVIGKLVRSYLGERGDAAICSITGRLVDPIILGHTKAITKIGRPTVGTRVAKSGRTTGLTYGIVKRTAIKVPVDYKLDEPVMVYCFEVVADPEHPSEGEISKGGDSGAAYLRVSNGKMTDTMVGLHFAGETSGYDRALVCYATEVFDELGIVPVPLF